MTRLALVLSFLALACGSDPGATPVPDGCTVATTCPSGQSGVTCHGVDQAQITNYLSPTAGKCAQSSPEVWCCTPTPAVIDDSPNCATVVGASDVCGAGFNQTVTCKASESQPREQCEHPSSSGDQLVWCCP